MSRLNYFKNRPKAARIDCEAYLRRLGLETQSPSLNYLKTIHRAHLHAIPFENLDIHYGKKTILETKHLFDKLIKKKRGGYCYELNCLFYHLLANLDFDTYLVSAQPYTQGLYQNPFDHVALLVNVDDKQYLCDVGFGKLFIEPKEILFGKPQLDFTEYYSFDQNPDGEVVLLHSLNNSTFSPIYKFDFAPKEVIEFIPRCNYYQESSDSKFKKSKIITQQFHEGRVSLTDKNLTTTLLGVTEERDILNEDEFHVQLQEHFGIDYRDLINQQFG